MLKKEDGFEGQVNIVLPGEIIASAEENPLIDSLYITDIGYYPRAMYHFRERPRGIDQHILIYVVQGKGLIRIGNMNYTIEPNGFVLIPAGKSHEYKADKEDPWTIYWIHFQGKKSELFANNSTAPQTLDQAVYSGINDRINLFREIIDNLSMGYSRENLEYSNMCLWHLLASFTHSKTFRKISRTSEHDMVKRAILFMKANISKKLSLDDLSASVGLSSSHFSRLFNLRTLSSPIDYMIQLKIQHACQLLDFTSLNISEVSIEVGYNDPYYFSRLFKKVMGRSPGRYRRRDN